MVGTIVKTAGILVLIGTVLCASAFVGAAFYVDRQFSKTGWKAKAYLSVVQARAQSQLKLDDLIALHPQQTTYSSSCYRQALSHYVEDHWTRVGHETGCDSNEFFCGTVDTQGNGLFQLVASETGQSLAHILAPPLLSLEKKLDPKLGHAIVEFANVRPIASKTYRDIRHVSLAMMPRNETAEFSAGYDPEGDIRKYGPPLSPDEADAILDELGGYLKKCQTFEPLPWVTIGATMNVDGISPYLTMAEIKIGLYNIVMSNYIGNRLPPDQRGTIGCLETLNQFRLTPIFRACQGDVKCIERLPTDALPDLSAQLQELKAHKCTSVYAYTLMKQHAP